MALSETACRNAKGRERPYKISDSEGLFLLVQPTGARLWRQSYRFDGKQKTLVLGKYPYVTLAEAREKRLAAKRLLAQGIDPGKVEVKQAEPFESVAQRWYDNSKDKWDESHSGRMWSRVQRDAFPEIGAMPIDTIKPPTLLAMLRKVEDRGAIEVAKRLKQSVSAVFRFAIAEGLIEHNPAAEIGAALKPSPRVRHMATIKPSEAHELVARIKGYEGEPITRIALLFALHTFVRTNELRFAKWSEIAGDLWKIPGERMKMGRDHIVPLTPTALALLDEARQYREGDYVFPGVRNGAISENRMLYALYRLGYHSRLTVHGFRRLASTTLNEEVWNADWIELQLAHVSKDKIRGIYNAAEYLSGRRDMMAWWSDYLNAAIQPSMSDSRQRTEMPPTDTGRGNSPTAMRR